MKVTRKQIPNILLLFRMLIALVVFAIFIVITVSGDGHEIYYINDPRWTHNSWLFSIAILFSIACITDFLDGYLARKYKWESDFGKLWDPIADKVLINITLIALAILLYIPWWIVVVMIIRDIVVDASRMHASSKGKVIAADVYGKLKTIFQMLGIIVILFIFDEQAKSFAYTSCSTYYWALQNMLIFVATFFSLFSGVNYIIKIYKPVKRVSK